MAPNWADGESHRDEDHRGDSVEAGQDDDAEVVDDENEEVEQDDDVKAIVLTITPDAKTPIDDLWRLYTPHMYQEKLIKHYQDLQPDAQS